MDSLQMPSSTIAIQVYPDISSCTIGLKSCLHEQQVAEAMPGMTEQAVEAAPRSYRQQHGLPSDTLLQARP